jgi:hypothetical protein
MGREHRRRQVLSAPPPVASDAVASSEILLAFEMMADDLLSAPIDDLAISDPMPPRLLMQATYSYFGEDGLFRNWTEGAIVHDRNEIEDLVARGAPVERLDA